MTFSPFDEELIPRDGKEIGMADIRHKALIELAQAAKSVIRTNEPGYSILAFEKAWSDLEIAVYKSEIAMDPNTIVPTEVSQGQRYTIGDLQ